MACANFPRGVEFGGLATLVHAPFAGTSQTLHRRLFLVPHCTLRLSHLSVGGNTRGLEMVRPTRHVGAGLRGHGWVRP